MLFVYDYLCYGENTIRILDSYNGQKSSKISISFLLSAGVTPTCTTRTTLCLTPRDYLSLVCIPPVTDPPRSPAYLPVPCTISSLPQGLKVCLQLPCLQELQMGL